jgi:hypothetical protein
VNRHRASFMQAIGFVPPAKSDEAILMITVKMESNV